MPTYEQVAAFCSIGCFVITLAEVGIAVYTLTHRRVRVWLERKFDQDRGRDDS